MHFALLLLKMLSLLSGEVSSGDEHIYRHPKKDLKNFTY